MASFNYSLNESLPLNILPAVAGLIVVVASPQLGSLCSLMLPACWLALLPAGLIRG